MSFFPPQKSFYNKRYVAILLGLSTVLLHALITSLYLKYVLINKYGKDYLSLIDKANQMAGDVETIQSYSLLFYPILFGLCVLIFFLISKERKETKNRIALFLLTCFLIFGYIWFFLDSVLLFTIPSLLLIGFLAALRGGYQEAQRIFLLLFLALITALGVDKLVAIYF